MVEHSPEILASEEKATTVISYAVCSDERLLVVHAGFNWPSRAHRVEHGLQRQRVVRALLQAEVLGHPKWRLRGFFYLRQRGPPSHVADVTAYVCDKHQPSLPTPFYSVLVSISWWGCYGLCL